MEPSPGGRGGGAEWGVGWPKLIIPSVDPSPSVTSPSLDSSPDMSDVRIPLPIFLRTRVHVRFHYVNYLEIELNRSEETLALAATEVEAHFPNMDRASESTRSIVATGYLLHALFAHVFVETEYPAALWTTEVGAFVLDKQRARLHALQTNCAVVDTVKELAEARRGGGGR